MAKWLPYSVAWTPCSYPTLLRGLFISRIRLSTCHTLFCGSPIVLLGEPGSLRGSVSSEGHGARHCQMLVWCRRTLQHSIGLPGMCCSLRIPGGKGHLMWSETLWIRFGLAYCSWQILESSGVFCLPFYHTVCWGSMWMWSDSVGRSEEVWFVWFTGQIGLRWSQNIL